jgi:Carbohydrate-binding module 48 (Isoamylase N-terminal domain)
MTPASAPSAQGAAALPGSPFPLGATPGEYLGIAGTHFAIASSVASSVTLCLFDEAGAETQIPVTDNDADVWHACPSGAAGSPRTTAPAGVSQWPSEPGNAPGPRARAVST